MEDNAVVKITIYISAFITVIACTLIISLSCYFNNITTKAFKNGYQHGTIPGYNGYCWVKVEDPNKSK